MISTSSLQPSAPSCTPCITRTYTLTSGCTAGPGRRRSPASSCRAGLPATTYGTITPIFAVLPCRMTNGTTPPIEAAAGPPAGRTHLYHPGPPLHPRTTTPIRNFLFSHSIPNVIKYSTVARGNICGYINHLMSKPSQHMFSARYKISKVQRKLTARTTNVI